MPAEQLRNIPTAQVPEMVKQALLSNPPTKKIEIDPEKPTYTPITSQTWTLTRTY